MDSQKRPRTAQPGGGKSRCRLNHALFATCRARGLSLAEAARAAGSQGTTNAGLVATGKALEARPEVAAAIDEARAKAVGQVEEDLTAAWTATVRWMRDVSEGTTEATNLDRIAVAQVIGRALGAFAKKPQTPEGPIPFVTMLTVRHQHETVRPPPLDARPVEASPVSSAEPAKPTSDDGEGR